MKKQLALSLLISPLLLSACAPLATGVGVVAGTAAVQEGGLSRAVSDARIQTEINDLWFRKDVHMFSKLDLTINQGRVLITGVVQDPQHRVEAVRLAWQPQGVVQVINEVKVANSDGITGFAKDTWITTRLRTAIILDRNVQSINYSIDTVQGSVYLMGFAQSQGELNKVIEIARTIENVKQVVSYVKLVGDQDKVTQKNIGSQTQATADTYRATSSANDAPLAAPAPEASSEPIQWNQDSVYD